MGHKGEWFPGEHEAIIDPTLFNAVQYRLKSNAVIRGQQRSDYRALLKGLLFDDHGNRMSPSFTSKRGVRYRFYVSSAILTARGSQAASVRRVSAPELEESIVAALRERFPQTGELVDQTLIAAHVEHIVLSQSKILITLKVGAPGDSIEISHVPKSISPRARIETSNSQPSRDPDPTLIQALARAHAWRNALGNGTYQSIDQLAAAVQWNAKVIRKVLRLAFLAPDITEAIMLGTQPTSLNVSELQEIAANSWNEQRRLLGFPART
jgi:hypothetical protein